MRGCEISPSSLFRGADQHSRQIVEAVIFESGRPILLLPEMTKQELPLVLNHMLSPGIIAELPRGPSLMLCLFCKQPSTSISLPLSMREALKGLSQAHN